MRAIIFLLLNNYNNYKFYKIYKTSHARMTRTNAMDQSRTPDSLNTMTDQVETLESLENGYVKREESTASPRSYLSMPSCKQFPSMRSVEPLSRVLEPVMVISKKC